MRVLITGFSGFAGGHLADHILDHTDWLVWGTVYGLDGGYVCCGDRVRAEDTDLLDPAAVARVVDAARPDLVFHLAGQSSVGDAWRDPWPTIETNVRMQLLLLQALADRAPTARVVAVISNEVYGAGPTDGRPTDESAPLAPINPYALSKVSQDMLASLYGKAHGIDVVRLRPFTHVGPRQSAVFVTASFARQVARVEAGRQEPVMRVGNLTVERDFTDVRDTVRAYRMAAEKGRSGDVYNIGSGTSWALRRVLDWFVGQASVPIEVVQDPALIRPADVPRTLCDATKARLELGWSPEISMEQTLSDILMYWRARVNAGKD